MGGDRNQPSGLTNSKERYEVLKNFFERYRDQHITILDYGANAGYFTNRLIEEFPTFRMIAVDGRKECEIPLKMSEAVYPGMKAITKDLYYKDIKELIKKENIDIVMCLNVFHYIEEHKKILDLLLEECESTIIERYDIDPLPNIHNRRVKSIYNYFIDKNTIQINEWTDYEQWRPIFYINDREIAIEGRPSDGLGAASKTTVKWNREILQKLLKTDYIELGTLNILINDRVDLKNPVHRFKNDFGDEFDVWPAYLFGYPVYIFHPAKSKVTNRIDIIAKEHLRTKFNLNNESKVVLSIDKKFTGV